jgi:hippurate hydrolase
VADNEAFSKAVQQGKKSPYYNHNGNYVVELSAIPLGTAIGSTALLEIMKK